MAGGGDPRESATERRLLVQFSFMKNAREKLKGCGKSAPWAWQHALQGKPHPEQNQIGTDIPCCSGRSGWLHEAFSNERPR